jgi:hypothetical protein
MLLRNARLAFSGFEFGKDKAFNLVCQYEVWEACSACGDVTTCPGHRGLCMVAVPAMNVSQRFYLLQE